jgi:hypothetical protein
MGQAQARHRYLLCGHLVSATFPLDGLSTTDRAEGALGAIELRCGTLPTHLDDAALLGSDVEVSPNAVLLKLPRIGGLLARGGTEIIVAPEIGAEGDMQPFVLGSGLGAVCLQRGILPLHASAVLGEAGAIAFIGPSGAGKSTMTAALVARGLPFVTDDVLVTTCAGGHTSLAYAGVPAMKLWPDAAAALRYDRSRAMPELSLHEKLRLAVDAVMGAHPLQAVYVLEPAEDDEIAITPLHGPTCIAALAGEIYRRRWLPAMGRFDGLLRQVGTIATGTPCFRLRRPRRFERLAEVIDTLLDHQAALAAPGRSAEPAPAR